MNIWDIKGQHLGQENVLFSLSNSETLEVVDGHRLCAAICQTLSPASSAGNREGSN